MSKFSERLKKHIDDNGVIIYQLAKKSGLDRTTIQRAISGERLPSLNFVEILSDYLRLSPTERAELIDLYSISKIGEKVYFGRKYIKEMIEKIADINSTAKNYIHLEKNIEITEKIIADSAVYRGQYIVNNMIRNILEDEVINHTSPEVNLSVPFHYNFLYDLLYQLYLSENGNISIRNLVRFNKTHAFDDSNYNLNILSHIMPFAFSAGNGYQLYYYYENYDSIGDIANLMPYYIITRKRLIVLSADFNTAILYNNKNILDVYKDMFDIAINKSFPLITQHYSCEDILLTFLEAFKDSGIGTHVIEPQPCFAWYYTEALIEAHLRPELQDRVHLIQLLNHLYGEYQNTEYRPVSIFSVEGLTTFVATGILSDLPTQFAIPFTIDERILLLEHLKSDMLSGKYKVHAVKTSKFKIPFSTIQLSDTKGLTFFTADNNGFISSAYIVEKSITEAFYDFFDSIPESGLLYTIDETIHIIDEFMILCISMKHNT